MEKGKKGNNLSIRSVYIIITAITLVLTVVGLSFFFTLTKRIRGISTAKSQYVQATAYAQQMQSGSDRLTAAVEWYVCTADDNDIFEYWVVVWEKQRDEAREGIENLLGKDSEEAEILSDVYAKSAELMKDEMQAMHLMLLYKGQADSESFAAIESRVKSENTTYAREVNEAEIMPTKRYEEIMAQSVNIDGVDYSTYSAGNEELQEKAIELIFSDNYKSKKATIDSEIEKCSDSLTKRMESNLSSSITSSRTLLTICIILVILLPIFMFSIIYVLYRMIVKPVLKINKSLEAGGSLAGGGSSELQELSDMFNRSKAKFVQVQEEIEEQNRLYKSNAEHDFLTKLANRQSLEDYLSMMFSGGVKPFILYMIDVDDFKKINDTYGHDAGDKLLVALAQSLSAVAEAHNGIAARYGGEEFVVTAANVTEDDVKPIAEEILNAVRNTKVEYGDTVLSATASVGSCFSLTGGRDKTTIIQNADGAMYKSKARGKNCHHRFKNIVTESTIES